MSVGITQNLHTRAERLQHFAGMQQVERSMRIVQRVTLAGREPSLETTLDTSPSVNRHQLGPHLTGRNLTASPSFISAKYAISVGHAAETRGLAAV